MTIKQFINIDNTRLVREMKNKPYISPTQKNILEKMAGYSHDDGTTIRPNIQTLVNNCGYDERTVRKSIKWLIEKKFLSQTITQPNGSHKPHEYALNLDLIKSLSNLSYKSYTAELAPGVDEYIPRNGIPRPRNVIPGTPERVPGDPRYDVPPNKQSINNKELINNNVDFRKSTSLSTSGSSQPNDQDVAAMGEANQEDQDRVKGNSEILIDPVQGDEAPNVTLDSQNNERQGTKEQRTDSICIPTGNGGIKPPEAQNWKADAVLEANADDAPNRIDDLSPLEAGSDPKRSAKRRGRPSGLSNTSKLKIVGINNSSDDPVVDIFKHWQTVLNHPRAKLEEARRKRIVNALNVGYSVEELKKAIDGASKSPWHMGQNDTNKVYDSIDLIFRNADKIDGFIQDSDRSFIRTKLTTGPVSFKEKDRQASSNSNSVYNRYLSDSAKRYINKCAAKESEARTYESEKRREIVINDPHQLIQRSLA